MMMAYILCGDITDYYNNFTPSWSITLREMDLLPAPNGYVPTNGSLNTYIHTCECIELKGLQCQLVCIWACPMLCRAICVQNDKYD